MNEDLTIEEMEKLLYNVEVSDEAATSDDSQSSDVTVEETPAEDNESVEENTVVDLAESAVDGAEAITHEEQKVEAAQQEHDWEKRYKNYKAKTDVTIHSLKMEVASLSSSLSSAITKTQELEKEILSSKKAEPKFTPEEEEILGSEGVNAITRSVEAAVKPLEKKLEKVSSKEAKELRRKSEVAVKEAYMSFLAELALQVPDYEQLNSDPEFIAYLDTSVDPNTGYRLQDLFSLAEKKGDSNSVAHFFKSFKALKAQEEIKRHGNLDENLTPSSSSSQAASTAPKKDKGEAITTEFIDKFYTDVSKGRYSRDEANRIEAKIDDAFVRGKIL